MKIILKNEQDGKLSIYDPGEGIKTRLGDLFTHVRKVIGHFHFQLTCPLQTQGSTTLHSQQDLDRLLHAHQHAKYLQLNIGCPPPVADSSWSEPITSFANESRDSSGSRRLSEASQLSRSQKSEVGKFRKVRRGSQEQVEEPVSRENEFLKSRVTEVLEKELEQLATKITNELSAKSQPVSELRECPPRPPHSPLTQLPRSQRVSTQQELNPFINEHYYGSTFKISNAHSLA